MTRVEPFGTWPSPLTSAAVAAGRMSRTSLSSDGRALYWLESRPAERGRVVLVRAVDGGPASEVSAPDVSIRSNVHEYGGGAWTLLAGPAGVASATAGSRAVGFCYVDQADQRVWMDIAGGGSPVALSPSPPDGERWNHGDLRSGPDGRWVLAVRERHRQGGAEVIRTIVCLRVDRPGAEVELVGGRDFVAAPRPSPTGDRLAWVCWDHPDMSWDSSELWIGDLEPGDDGLPSLVRGRVLDGGEGVSVGQPLWESTADHLVYMSDREGWWQPWRVGAGRDGEPALRLCGEEVEFHSADWQLGQATLAELETGLLACRWRAEGLDHLGVLDARSGGRGTLAVVAQPCTAISAVCSHAGGIAWLGSTPWAQTSAWWCPDPLAQQRRGGSTGSGATIVGQGPAAPLPAEDVSTPEPMTFVAEGGRPVHLVLYRPALRGLAGPPGARPPLIVICHGGPTGAVDVGFDPVVQLFTTRGYAVAAVDYAGSTGYGTTYRRSLWGSWGVADVEDCLAAARHLSAAGIVDGSRIAIRGASSGGLTALGALAAGRVFAAAVSWYGVTDLMGLAATTHDFESRYLDRLVGPLPEAADEYRRRSPRYRVADMAGAVLLLQGLDDPVVPPAQATAMASELVARGLRCEVLTFEGEAHGFRRADTLERCFEAELAFYESALELGVGPDAGVRGG